MIKIHSTNVTIMVRDMDESIKFYKSLGLKLKQRWGNHYAMVVTKGITLGLHPSENKEHSSGTTSIGFMVDSLVEAKKMLEQNLIPIREDEGKSGKYLHFHDPDGTALYFVEPEWKE
jgi:catechol 2,3-dioxygenase-like lactoylglutathione lyase family enzyme